MKIEPESTNSIFSSNIQNNALSAEEKLKQLTVRIGDYFTRFSELFADAKNVHAQHFISLELLGHELEVSAQHAQLEIRELAKVDLPKSKELKELYDKELGNLYSQMKSIIDKVLPKLKSEIELKYQSIAEIKGVNPPAVLDLTNSIKQFKMLVVKVEQEIQRVQSQRLFQI